MFILAALAAAQLPSALASQPTVPPAVIDDKLEVTGDALKARQVRTRLSVKTMVNRQGPYDFFVDSGADRTVIGAGLAARLGLPVGPEVTLHGTAGIARVGTVRIESLKIGNSEVFNFIAPALAEQNIGGDGLLGIDALADQRLMLDFEKKRIIVQDSRAPDLHVGAEDEVVVTARRRKGQLILTQASVANTNLYAIIDTGTEVTVGNSALRRRIMGNRRNRDVRTIELVSVTGQSTTADFIVVPSFKLGGITLTNVPIAFADTPPFAVFGLDKQPALLLGTDVLEAFRRVSLDFRLRKVRFVLKS